MLGATIDTVLEGLPPVGFALAHGGEDLTGLVGEAGIEAEVDGEDEVEAPYEDGGECDDDDELPGYGET